MKTKYILSGGHADRPNEENDKFFKEILNTEKKELKILLVYFAKNESEYERMTKGDKYQFEHLKGDKELSFEIAEKEKFRAQVREADIVYLHGGRNLRLLKFLKAQENIKELFSGKIVAGESAGAYVLSTCFYSKSEGGVFEGLGLVPVKTICHYIGENKEKLEECPEELETLLLPDYEYKVFWNES